MTDVHRQLHVLPHWGRGRRSTLLSHGDGVVVCWLTSQQHASVSRGRICSDNCMRCHTEIEVADQTFHLTQSQYADTGPTSPSADPMTPGARQGSHWSASLLRVDTVVGSRLSCCWYVAAINIVKFEIKIATCVHVNEQRVAFSNNDFISIALFHVKHAQLR